MKIHCEKVLYETMQIKKIRDICINGLLGVHYLTVFFSISLLILVSGCKKENCDNPRNPECSNYDACIDAIETNADFGFYFQYSHNGKTLYFPYYDTVYVTSPFGGRKWFRAYSDKMNQFTWIVGSDSRVFTDSVFNLFFDNVPIDYHLDVKLKVKNNKVSISCFPLDTGTSEIEKTLVFKRIYNGPYPITLAVLDSLNHNYIPIFGKFHGSYTDDAKDTCTVEVFTNEFRDMEVRSLCRPNPLGLRNEVNSNNQYGFHRGIHQITYQLNFTSIGIIDREDRDKLVIIITDNRSDSPPRRWEGQRMK